MIGDERKSNHRAYFLVFVVTLAVCFCIQSVALNMAGGRTIKSESNYFSSVGRIQAAARARADALLLGSSITGRLPDRSQGFPGFANMGIDGGSAVDTLRAIDRGLLPSGKLLLIEGNTLFDGRGRSASQVYVAMGSVWFRLGIIAGNVSAYARPSAFLYSRLLKYRIGSNSASDSRDLEIFTQPEYIDKAMAPQLDSPSEKLVSELADILLRLKAKGARAIVVWLPAGSEARTESRGVSLSLCRSVGVEWWDIAAKMPKGSIVLTDEIHMDAASAARIMRSISHGLHID
jgi:hypothetical protein